MSDESNGCGMRRMSISDLGITIKEANKKIKGSASLIFGCAEIKGSASLIFGCAVYGTMKQERIGRDAVRPKGGGMDARIKTVW